MQLLTTGYSEALDACACLFSSDLQYGGLVRR